MGHLSEGHWEADERLVLRGVQIRALPGDLHSKDVWFSFQKAAQGGFYPYALG